MEIVKTILEPTIEVQFTKDEQLILLLCSTHHYDATCRESGRSGVLNGIRNMQGKWILKFRDADLLAKVVEPWTPDATKEQRALFNALMCLMQKLNDAYAQANGLNSTTTEGD